MAVSYLELRDGCKELVDERPIQGGIEMEIETPAEPGGSRNPMTRPSTIPIHTIEAHHVGIRIEMVESDWPQPVPYERE